MFFSSAKWDRQMFVKLFVSQKYKHPWSVEHLLAADLLFISFLLTKDEKVRKQTKWFALKLDEKFTFPSSSLSSPTNSTARRTIESYYKDLPVQDLKNLYNRFKLDFKLFGYPEPDYVNGKIIPDWHSI